MRRLASVLVLWCVAVGCDDNTPPTAIVLVVDTDLDIPSEVDRIRLAATNGTSGNVTEHTANLTGGNALDLPLVVTLRPKPKDASVRLVLTAERGGTEVVKRTIDTEFVQERSMLLEVTLTARCLEVLCSITETCGEDGSCVPRAVAPATLAEVDPATLPGGNPDVCTPTGAGEACNLSDDDCDGAIDEGLSCDRNAWVSGVGNATDSEQVGGLALAPNGQTYLLAAAANRVETFAGPLPPVDNVDGQSDMLLLSYDATGTIDVGSRRLGGRTAERVQDLAWDDAGNLYALGSFSGEADFGGSSLAATATDVFVAKYGPDLSLAWAASFGAGGDDTPYAITVDGNNVVYVAAHFANPTSLGGPNPVQGTTIFRLSQGAGDPTTDWARSLGAPPTPPRITALAADNTRVFVWGSRTETIVLGEDRTLTGAGGFALGLAAADGGNVWERGFPANVTAGDMVAGTDAVYATAAFTGTVDFGGEREGDGERTATLTDLAVMRFEGTDGATRWVSTLTSLDPVLPGGMAISGRVLAVGGTLTATVAGPDGLRLRSVGEDDAFVATLEESAVGSGIATARGIVRGGPGSDERTRAVAIEGSTVCLSGVYDAPDPGVDFLAPVRSDSGALGTSGARAALGGNDIFTVCTATENLL